MPSQLDLSVMLPADQVELVDEWERTRDADAQATLELIALTREEVSSSGLVCIGCHHLTRCVQSCTYVLASGDPFVRRAVICCSCTKQHDRAALRMISVHSYAQFLAADVAAQRGSVLHAPGHA
jgi:transketolase